ncbi:ATP-dependent DNA helicase PIF2-like [Juglans microcarpa x Juglans regia]|uniref:ATP-dependent DNA helicase PIF2-like n=1 Tax=Juglans microcarpa x Juglans regia TaxID=2249226 RepID=UPI001B7F2144|nr:ATP-dependent DNA helicase PIF2-like [Juglans microcarpa x Juglans regia]
MYHFAPTDTFYDVEEFINREIDDERAVTILEEDLLASNSLNSEQKNAYNLILQTLLSNESDAFFIDGPAGTSKTFLYKALLATIRSKNMIALAVASSGVVASILPGGQTTHSRFKIPLNADKDSTCNVVKQGSLAKLLRLTKLIIWDEAPMSTKYSIEALDKMLRDINDIDLPFGGKVIVLGGDFRQILPVIRKSTKEQQIDASLASSYIWLILKKIKLTENMRARLDLDFSQYLIEVGNGNAPITIDENIKISQQMIVPYNNEVESLNSLLDVVYGNMSNYSNNLTEMANRAVLTPKNRSVDEINDILIDRFPGDIIRYYSFDETVDASKQGIMKDFLNTLTPNGLPPHELLLKKNCPIMLIRNINPS